MKKESERAKKAVGSIEPHVGIFWLVNGRLLIDSTPLSKAEPYADHLGHARSHIDVWTRYQRSGKVPSESEYEEFPRGRVTHHPASGECAIFADRCILNRKDLIARLKDELQLPNKTKLATDLHYRCHHCLYGTQEDSEE
jgi:hypothetical protein